MIDESEYIRSLKSQEIVKKYEGKVSQLLRDLKTEVSKEKNNLNIELSKEIRKSETHDQLVSMAIVPSLTNSKIRSLGYRFVRCAPLLEKNLKNIDFLIFKDDEKKSIAIFGEVKTSISDPNKVIKEFLERKKEIAKHRTYILENYLQTRKDVIFEYVLCVFSRDAVKMKTAIEKNNGGIILWSADLGLVDLTLIASEKSELKPTMLHVDHDLCNALNQTKTSLKAAIHYVQSHVVIRLRALVITKDYISSIKDERTQRFKKEDLAFYLDKTLFYLPKDMREVECKYLIKTGIENEILKEENGEFLISTKGKGAKSQTKEIEKKWLFNKIKRKNNEIIETEIQKIRDECTNLDNKQKALEDFNEGS